MLFIFIAATTVALVAGAAWALLAPLPRRVEAFIVACSGGALLIAAVMELIQPVLAQHTSPLNVFIALLAGGAMYSALLAALERSDRTDQAGMVISTMLLNGIPENVAVGVSLIGHNGIQVTALIGSIFLANVPEAAGATQDLRARQYRGPQIARTWALILFVLAAAALAGHYGLGHVGSQTLGYLRCFAAGAIISSLAVDVFPKAFKADHRLTGIATVLGVVLALALNRLG